MAKKQKEKQVATTLEQRGPEPMKNPAGSSELAVEEARRLLLAQQTAKTEACVKEIDAVLRKHGCSLDVSMLVTTRGVQPNVRVIPRSDGQGT